MYNKRAFGYAYKVLIGLLISILFIVPLFKLNNGLNTAYADTVRKSITIFSWEDYIDEGSDGATGLIEEFENSTGIKVNYHTFATNEEMYTELKKDPNACDLICPSEYMILKMKQEGLIKPYAVPDNYAKYGSPYIKSVFDGLGLNDETTGKTYAIGYMWGTMGLIYNADKYDADDFKNWSNLYDEKFSGRITIKDSIRDTYIMTLGIVYEKELLELKNKLKNSAISLDDYKDELTAIFNKTDEETVDKVGEALIDLKKHLHSFEVDAGKIDLLTGKIDVNFAWSGDAVYAMYEAENANISLGYAVPEEGSNVWFDGWVMTNNADEESAGEFLDFISSPQCAIRNMDYVGYTSCIAGDEVFNYVKESFDDFYDPENPNEPITDEHIANDLNFFFDPNDVTGKYKVNVLPENKNGYLYAQYADADTINRCAVMDNFNDADLEIINEMWNKVKLITLSDLALILIGVGVVLLILAIVLYIYREKVFAKLFKGQKTTHEKKGYKTIKVEKLDTY